MGLHLNQSQRLELVISISLCFFIAEISVGFYTKSLALVADAFHYLNDLIGFVVAFAALKISAKKNSPQDLSFGWQRSRLLGAFFNGVFLLALGVSIFLQSIERFVSLQPLLSFTVGPYKLNPRWLSADFFLLPEHDHSRNELPGAADTPVNTEDGTGQVFAVHDNHRHNNLQPTKKGYDLGMLGVLIHVLGDAANNVGVIISALVIWLTTYPARYYADPAVSMAIAIVILTTSIPLVRNSGKILLESVPKGINLGDIRHDLETIPGVLSVHELHVWHLNQEKALASVHVAISNETVSDFVQIAKTMNDCFHSYGIHSATVQPEMGSILTSGSATSVDGQDDWSQLCQVKCGASCEVLTCCG
ncbi:cation diffusion facilitator family metal ion transporter, putative [Talaromyces stipitatus ATCC 10500]|uniref:Cation diffusion facilitator family metal ion transporter, putative n=1 Tax=Talaromyces stipitatus (strain ATCC 10500 / CBS 375.48 / QM 6759 / NRRL 1006) TaxID=441959 RepID=B8ME38_TALSN|nr:cation diffusion facilitator family metal ion transporter, putative [Talaromyces stipitatus ATCC 10500]EED16115.1 cation diffusion facilitator family metal ion transporter, putative [Talaromyces stipitatus ATCC 10500]